MKEFDLSENVHHPNECSVCKIDDFSKVYFESDVKEFIKLLKEDLNILFEWGIKTKNINPNLADEVIEKIDELAGERLKELRK